MKAHESEWKVSGADSFYSYVAAIGDSPEQYERLTDKGRSSSTGRSRFCYHDSPNSKLHLMLIYHDARTVVPIHRHNPYGEFIIIKRGSVKIEFYNNELSISETYLLDASQFFGPLYIAPNQWHRLVIEQQVLFFEISEGPLNGKTTDFA